MQKSLWSELNDPTWYLQSVLIQRGEYINTKIATCVSNTRPFGRSKLWCTLYFIWPRSSHARAVLFHPQMIINYGFFTQRRSHLNPVCWHREWQNSLILLDWENHEALWKISHFCKETKGNEGRVFRWRNSWMCHHTSSRKPSLISFLRNSRNKRTHGQIISPVEQNTRFRSSVFFQSSL